MEQDLIILGERRRELQDMPINEPSAVPKRSWKRKEGHGKATVRALITSELRERRER